MTNPFLQNYMLGLQNNRSMQQNTMQKKTLVNPNSLKTNVKAYPAEGSIIEKDILGIKHAVRNDKKSAKYFFDGISGKGTDYSIGRINDLATKLTSLGIAIIIAASKGSPLKKGMEFAGLGCWLGAMSLWPKLAVHLPIKLYKGVDLDTEYVNEQGQVKKFCEDPQYMCWDLISKEDKHKMGDKLGIPENIKNREQAIENKAKQVAIQGNTIALLSAGLATPLAASLAGDQVAKKIMEPLFEKKHINDTAKLQDTLKQTMNTTFANQNVENTIQQLITENMSDAGKEQLATLLDSQTSDIVMKNAVKNTINNIWENASSTNQVAINDNLSQSIAQKLSKGKNFQEIFSTVQELSGTYKNALINNQFDDFLSELGETLVDKELLNPKNKDNVMKEVQSILDKSKTITFASPDILKAKFISLSRFIESYNGKITNGLDNYNKYAWNLESSANARMWEQTCKDIFNTLNIKGKDLKTLANIPISDDYLKTMADIFDRIAQDPNQFNSTMKQLGDVASKNLTANSKILDRNFEFAMQYIDEMQKQFTAVDQTGEFLEQSQTVKAILSAQRKEILGKYLSAKNAMYAPVRILSVLEEAKADKDIDINILKKFLFENQSVDGFMNKFDQHKSIIKNDTDYYKYVNTMFSGISEKAKAFLPPELVNDIDATSNLSKVLLTGLTDDVNVKYTSTDMGKLIEAFKATNIIKYFDEFCDLSIDGEKAKQLSEKITNTIKENPSKIEELKTFLQLTPENIADIKTGNMQSIIDNCLGTKESKGFLDNGTHRIKTLLNFFDNKETAENLLGYFNVSQTKAGKVSFVIGDTMVNYLKDNAKKALEYNGWFKKTAGAFVAVCALTGLAILGIGKTNEFNPDIYEERKSA